MKWDNGFTELWISEIKKYGNVGSILSKGRHKLEFHFCWNSFISCWKVKIFDISYSWGLFFRRDVYPTTKLIEEHSPLCCWLTSRPSRWTNGALNLEEASHRNFSHLSHWQKRRILAVQTFLCFFGSLSNEMFSHERAEFWLISIFQQNPAFFQRTPECLGDGGMRWLWQPAAVPGRRASCWSRLSSHVPRPLSEASST